MSDYDLPELPSDDELGITEEDREYLKELGDDRPEMSDAEMQALLGDAPARPSASGSDATTDTPDPKAAKKAAKEAKKAARAAKKEEKRRAKEAKKKQASGEETDSERAERVARSLGAMARGEAKPEAPEPPKPEQTVRAKRPEAPRSRWRGPGTLVALILISVIASTRTGLPGTVPANAPDTAFSSSRAMSMLIEIAREAHPPGSPEHARVREYLVERLRSLGLEPEVDTLTSVTDDTGAEGEGPPIVRVVTARNIVARIPGTDPTGAVLITAHYDGRELSVAASDDGVGVVTIIEAVRALLAGEPLANDVLILLTDAEELGLMGARAFVDQHPWMDEVDLVFSFEMRGAGGPTIMFETNDRNGWVVRALQTFDPHPFANSMAFDVYRRMSRETDFTPFKEAGTQGLNFAAIGNAHVYHQEYDTPQALDERTLQHHGLNALAALRHFGHADLAEVNDDNVVYFAMPFVGIIVYDEGWVLPLSGLLVALLLGVGLVAKRTGRGHDACSSGCCGQRSWADFPSASPGRCQVGSAASTRKPEPYPALSFTVRGGTSWRSPRRPSRWQLPRMALCVAGPRPPSSGSGPRFSPSSAHASWPSWGASPR